MFDCVLNTHLLAVKNEETNYVYGPFLWMALNCLRSTEPLQGGSLLFKTQSQEFMVLILSISEGWEDELNLELPSGFEPGTPQVGI